MCKLDGITVTVPRAPDTSDPPPIEPPGALDPYTPPSGGTGSWGRIWTFTSDDEHEAMAPPIGGAYDEGPGSFAACVLAGVGAANLAQAFMVVLEMRQYRWALGQLNEAEVRLQIAQENRNDMGESLLIHYQEERNRAQERLNKEKQEVLDAINQHKAVTAGAFTLSVMGCAAVLWAPMP